MLKICLDIFFLIVFLIDMRGLRVDELRLKLRGQKSQVRKPATNMVKIIYPNKVTEECQAPVPIR